MGYSVNMELYVSIKNIEVWVELESETSEPDKNKLDSHDAFLFVCL